MERLPLDVSLELHCGVGLMELPESLCPRCAAILSAELVRGLATDGQCPFCRQVWKRCVAPDWNRFFHTFDAHLKMDNQEHHAEFLAGLTRHDSEFWGFERAPLGILLDLFASAKKSIHFMTWSISDAWLGALALVAQRLPVRGVIAVMDERQQNMLRHLQEEVYGLDVLIYGTKGQSQWSAPHQKLIVIDGVLAVEGSANLTYNAWAKIAEGKERVRYVTDLAEVRDLNNSHFARNWRRSRYGGEEVLEH